ncbi:MAG: hypothetical protein K0S41_2101 [Anaerocolumna sp.]|jgi:UPF0755 protein|nr:hypothetical protein [Anaerocolumna sp.]
MTSKPTTAQLVLKVTSFILRLLLNTFFYVIVIILITRVSKLTFDFCYEIFGQVTLQEAPGRDVEIQIKKGESTMNVASKLETNRVIGNKYSFYVKAKLMKHTIMPGTYTVNTSMTYDEIFTIITVPNKEPEDSEQESNTSKSDDSAQSDKTSADETESTNDTQDADN